MLEKNKIADINMQRFSIEMKGDQAHNLHYQILQQNHVIFDK